MDFEDEHWGFKRSGPRPRARVFSNSNDENAHNLTAWRDGVAATHARDPAGMAKALVVARGGASPIGRSGKPRRDAISKAVLKLRDDRQAWRRLRTSRERWAGFGDEAEPAAEWQPHGVDLLSYMWARDPQALALAARAWRESCGASRKWWSSPFLGRGLEGFVQVSTPLSHALLAHHPELQPHAGLNDRAPAIPIEESARGPELQALGDILAEVARASIESMWSFELSAREKRARGEIVWARGGSGWGLDWARAWEGRNSTAAADGAELHGMPRGAERAVDAIMAEASALSPEEGAAAAARLALSLQETELGALSVRALRAWASTDPRGELDLPLGAHDWMEPRLVARFPVTDDQLARFLAGPGSNWSAPAYFERGGDLRTGAPAWSYKHEAWRWQGPAAHPGLGDWTALEWMLLMGRPEAARRACSLGAKLHPSFETALAAAGRWNFTTPIEEALVLAEACRISETLARPEPLAAARPSPRL